jgi:hypothetical protein
MIDWLVENWDGIFKWIGVAVTVCTSIVKATPTVKDDTIAGKVVKVADWLSVVNTAENKAKLEKYAKKK